MGGDVTIGLIMGFHIPDKKPIKEENHFKKELEWLEKNAIENMLIKHKKLKGINIEK